MIDSINRFLSIHKAAVYSILSTFIRMFTGPLSIYLISEKLNVETQALYYVFLSISAIQWVFEMGVTTCLVQRISSTNEVNVKSSSLGVACVFFLSMSILMFISINVFALWVFYDVEKSKWFYPWSIYAISMFFTLLANVVYIYEEAMGNPVVLFRAKFISGVYYAISLLFSLGFGCGLFSLAIAQLVMILTMFFILKANFKNIINIVSGAKVRNIKNEFLEILPFQLKLMIVWFFGYFYWNFYSIYFLKYKGIELSSQYGATNAILSAISFSCISFLQTKRSQIGKMISIGQSTKKVFINATFLGVMLFIVSSILVIIVINSDYIVDSSRFLLEVNLLGLVLLRLLAMIIEMIFIYLRCFNDEPLYKQTIFLYLIAPLLTLVADNDTIFMPSVVFMLIMLCLFITSSRNFLRRKSELY